MSVFCTIISSYGTYLCQVLAEELEGVNDILTMNFCAKNLDNKVSRLSLLVL